MPNNPKTFFKSLRYLFLVFIFVLGLITVIASGGGGGDDSSGTTDTTDPTDTTDDTTWTSVYDPANLPTGTSFSDTAYSLTGATEIILNTTSVTINGTGASANGSVATIESSGTYNIHGTLNDGQIIVNVDTEIDTGVVKLVLNGTNISCSNSAPINITSAEIVYVILPDGTANSLTDGTAYENLVDLEPDAALFSKDDLVIFGEGTLTVDANYNNGIKSKDGLIIDSGDIEVTAVDDGIIGKNYISIEDGNIIVNATAGDGLKSTNLEYTTEEDIDTTKGYIFIEAGNISIDAGADAIQAETHIVVKGGIFDLTTAGGSTSTIDVDTETAKGFKANIGVTIYDGEFTIDSADDAIHSDDTIVVHGGTFDSISVQNSTALSANGDHIGGDAFDGLIQLIINNGDINVVKAYEGIESYSITINGGNLHLVTSDDPINATDGSGSMMSTVGYLYINGGYIYLNCGNSDGLDSNGLINMKGGTVIVNGPVSGGNGILDYASFTMSGGFIIGAGTSDMAQAPGSAASAQYALLIYLTSQQTAGTLFHIETSTGTDVVTFKPAKAYASIVFSSSTLAAGNYVYNIGGNYTGGTNKDGLYTGGTYSGGTDTSFEISSKVTTVGTAPTGGGRGGM